MKKCSVTLFRRQMLSISLGLASAVASAATEVVWDQSAQATALANGALQVSYDAAGAVTTLNADPEAAEGLNLTGGDMTFSSSGAVIGMDSEGALKFANVVKANGESDETPAEIDIGSSAALRGSPCVGEIAQPDTSLQLLMTNATLAEISGIKAVLDGNKGRFSDAVTCFVKRQGSFMTCEIQKKTSSTLLRAVVLRFEQQGNDIYVKHASYGHVGVAEADKEGDVSIVARHDMIVDYVWADCHVVDLQVSFFTDCRVAAVKKPNTTLMLVEKNALLSSLTNVTAVLDGTKGRFTDPVVCFFEDHGNYVTCEVQKKTSSTLLRAVVLRFEQQGNDIYVKHANYGHVGVEETSREGEFSIVSRHDMIVDSVWNDCYVDDLCVTLVTDRQVATMAKPDVSSALLAGSSLLADMTNAIASLDGRADVKCDNPVTCFFKRSGNRVTCEIQKKTSPTILRAVVLRFEQSGNDVYVRHLHYGHKTVAETVKEGEISIESDHDMIVDTIWNDCYVVNLKVEFAGIATRSREVELAAANSLENVSIRIGLTSPATLKINNKDAFPKSGTVEVGPYGMLQLYTAGADLVLDGLDNGVPITIHKGGSLVYSDAGALSATKSHVVLDGGVMAVCPHYANYDSDLRHYVHDITFRNGARVYGCDVTVRAQQLCWKVEGSSPSYLDSRVWCWAQWVNTRLQFELDVDDVTDDAEPDFLVAKSFCLTTTSDDLYRAVTLTKKGAGTAHFAETFVMTNRPTRVVEGMLAFANGALSGKNDFVLAGGGLSFDAGGANAANVLAVEGNGRLTLGAGATVSFADSRSAAWSPDAVLVVDGVLSANSLRFGTDAHGLTRTQRKQIRLATDAEGTKVARLSADGYLTFEDGNPGCVLLVR